MGYTKIKLVFLFETSIKHYNGYAQYCATFGINVLKQFQRCFLFFEMKCTFLVFQMELLEAVRETPSCQELLMGQKATKS